MKQLTLTLCLIPTLLVVACAPATQPGMPAEPFATSTPTQSNLQRGTGSDVFLMEETPTMELTILILDERTEQPVVGNVYLGGRLLGSNTSRLVVILPDQLHEEMTVRAPNYHEAKLHLQYQIQGKKFMVMPIRLKPIHYPAEPI